MRSGEKFIVLIALQEQPSSNMGGSQSFNHILKAQGK